jgi:hypothetical protein
MAPIGVPSRKSWATSGQPGTRGTASPMKERHADCQRQRRRRHPHHRPGSAAPRERRPSNLQIDAGSSELALATASVPETGDQIVENEGARVFLEPEAAALLGDQVLDAETDPAGKVQFTCHPAGSTNGSTPA